MERNEKLLLLQLILNDIRCDWGFGLENRVDKAYELAREVELDNHIKRIESFKRNMNEGYADGRHFRSDYTNGGYEYMEEMHGLSRTLFDKSREFREACRRYLNCPDMVLDIFGLEDESI